MKVKKNRVVLIFSIIGFLLFMSLYAESSIIRDFSEIRYSGNLVINASSLSITNAIYNFMVITTLGNVGIGTTEPGSAKFNVSGVIDASQVLINGTAVSTGSMDYTNIAMTNQSNTFTPNQTFSNSVFVTNSVGIGTTGPNSKLEVAGTIHSTSGGFKFPDGTIQTKASSDAGIKVLDKDITEVTVVSSSAETAIYSFTVPGGTLGTNKQLRLNIAGSHLKNAPGVSGAVTINLKYGSTTVATRVVGDDGDSSTTRGLNMEFYLNARGATNSQFGSFSVNRGNSMNSGAGTSAEDSTADKSLVVTTQFANAHGSITLTKYSAVLELIN